MDAIIPIVSRHKLYDNVIAKDIETIASFSKFVEEKNETMVAIQYDGGIDTKYMFQLARIYHNCVPSKIIIYVDASYKNFRKLKKENSTMNLKKVNSFNRKNFVYVVKPSYLKNINKNEFSKERFYTPDLIQDIWYEYYEPSTKETSTDDV